MAGYKKSVRLMKRVVHDPLDDTHRRDECGNLWKWFAYDRDGVAVAWGFRKTDVMKEARAMGYAVKRA